MHRPCFRAPALAIALIVTLSHARAETVAEDFSADPAARGWQAHGQTNLFAWDSVGHSLRVTWDSSKSNSYLVKPLGMALSGKDDFAVEFDLRLDDWVIGATPGKPYGFQIAAGLVNGAQAMAPGFIRGTGQDSPNLIEFDYWPDDFYPSISASMADTNGNMQFAYVNAPLVTGVVYHVSMAYSAQRRKVETVLSYSGQFYTNLATFFANANFTDFAVDRFAVASYSDEGQADPQWAGSVLAHGVLDNLVITLPPPVARISGRMAGNVWQVQFYSRTNWSYLLERTTNWLTWDAVSATLPGTGDPLNLQDANPPADGANYRVRAQTP